MSNLVYIQTISSLHIGSGMGIGAIEMPIQRERHTGYPIIPSSSFKGVLKAKCENEDKENVFGKEDKAGSLCFLDAKILFYPVRSLKGSFVLTTCKSVLERYKRDIALIGKKETFKIPDVEKEKIIVSSNSCIADEQAVLEEFTYSVQSGDLCQLSEYFKDIKDTKDINIIDNSTIALLHDDDFSYFARQASEVYARIAIDNETKTARDKALFYQEFVPAESIFYTMIINNANFKQENLSLKNIVHEFIQLGGNETTGKGICKTYFGQ